MITLSNAQARRIALAAQGFADPRPTGRVDRRHLRRVLDRIGLIQIDSVNVLVRSQELPLFARLGPHPRTLIDDAITRRRAVRVLGARGQPRPDGPVPPLPLANARAVPLAGLPATNARSRPTTSSRCTSASSTKARWWRAISRRASARRAPGGTTTTARSRSRRCSTWVASPLAGDRTTSPASTTLRERMIPADALARPALPAHEARKELLVLAARYHGVGTLQDLADYHRLSPTRCKPALAELVEEGRLLPVTVREWDRPAYLHPEARLPRRISARALLSPFDPVVWSRDRALRMFGFHYRIEIYTPPPKRQYGYYVLPFLLGEELVGRVDLKADRANRALRVQSRLDGAGRERVRRGRRVAGGAALDGSLVGAGSHRGHRSRRPRPKPAAAGAQRLRRTRRVAWPVPQVCSASFVPD